MSRHFLFLLDIVFSTRICRCGRNIQQQVRSDRPAPSGGYGAFAAGHARTDGGGRRAYVDDCHREGGACGRTVAGRDPRAGLVQSGQRALPYALTGFHTSSEARVCSRASDSPLLSLSNLRAGLCAVCEVRVGLKRRWQTTTVRSPRRRGQQTRCSTAACTSNPRSPFEESATEGGGKNLE